MNAFWHFAKIMLRRRAAVAWALFFALISAGGLGAGILSLGPMLKSILKSDSLFTLAEKYNQEDHFIAVPEFVIAKLPADRLDGVMLVIGFIAVLTILGGIANFMHQFISQTLATKTIAKVRQDMYSHVINMPLGIVIQRGPSEFVARMIRDAAELQRGLIALVSKSVTQILKGISAFAVALYINWSLTLTATIAAPLLIIVMRKLGKRIRRGTRGSLEAQEGLLRIATETISGLRAVKANTGEQQATTWFKRINEKVVIQELRIRTARALTAPLTESLSVFVVGGLAIVAAKLIIDGEMPFEDFILSLGSLAVAGGSFRPLAGLINEMQAASAPAARILEIIETRREAPETENLPKLARHSKSIKFEHVTLKYPGTDSPAIKDISLEISHGERIAIVGPNGSGKTTLVSLVPRLVVSDQGSVFIDSVDTADVSLSSLRQQIGFVTQDTVLFGGSIAENIAFGAGEVSREQIVDAAKRAHAEQFILELPGGFDANIAEQGASLSGGQRQRLAIARAILRDPSILILDEATSQIDAESEAHIGEALSEFCKGRTSLVVAHRLSTVISADRIVVMEAGQIIDQGTHDELLGRCDLYRRLTQTQLISAT
ncbi:MAG: ABC transporter ATP-binding protein [Planctomycetes bacterium]|nr:ABC transporter ATP-binding protein [Planctomycetota bacterium]